MKKNYFLPILMGLVLLILLIYSNKTDIRLAHTAEALNKSCPYYVGEFGTCVKVTSVENTLVFKLQMLPYSLRPDSENSTTFQIDSMINRPEDTKILLGSIFFQPSTELFEKKRNTDFADLIDMGCSMRIDFIREDSSVVTSTFFSSKEMIEQVNLCLNRANVDSVAYEDILELHKAYSILSVPQEYNERIFFVSADYDKKSYNRHFQIVDYSMWFKVDDKMMHDEHVKMIEDEVVVPFYMKSSAVNDMSALVEACANTNRDLVYHYSSDKGQQRKVVVTADELKQILKKEYVPSTMPEKLEMPEDDEILNIELNDIDIPELPDLPDLSKIPD